MSVHVPMGRPDPRQLTSLQDILSALSALQTDHTQLENTLNDLLNDRQPIITSLDRLSSLLPSLDDIHAHALVLQRNVDATAKTADRVGLRVRSLDEEMRRIRESGDRVGQVIELRVCLHSTFIVLNVELAIVVSLCTASRHRRQRLGVSH